MDFYSARPLKQQSTDRCIAPLGHIILISLCSFSFMLRGEVKNTNFIVLGFTRSGLKSTIYHTLGEHANYYIIDAVSSSYQKILYPYGR
jgi:hypothetical protein